MGAPILREIRKMKIEVSPQILFEVFLTACESQNSWWEDQLEHFE